MGEAAARLRALKAKALQAADDYNAKHRQERMHIGPITRTHKDVLEAIVGFVAREMIHPGYAAIARVVGCAVSTVGAAIVRLKAAGLISWANSWHWNARERRVTRTANHYSLGNFPRTTENQSAPQQEKKSGASQVMGARSAPKPTVLERLDAAISQLMALKPR
jgi:hypothetical protein